jgi:hypothetical protein
MAITADKIRIFNPQTISRFETGRQIPHRADVLLRLARAARDVERMEEAELLEKLAGAAQPIQRYHPQRRSGICAATSGRWRSENNGKPPAD